MFLNIGICQVLFYFLNDYTIEVFCIMTIILDIFLRIQVVKLKLFNMSNKKEGQGNLRIICGGT